MGCGPKGRRFESCQAYHDKPPGNCRAVLLCPIAVPEPSRKAALVYLTSWRGVRVVEGAALEKR